MLITQFPSLVRTDMPLAHLLGIKITLAPKGGIECLLVWHSVILKQLIT